MVIGAEWRTEIHNNSGMVKLAKTPRMTLGKLEIHSWIILCGMKDACHGEINICSASYVTHT
jgi:hypothetical protein